MDGKTAWHLHYLQITRDEIKLQVHHRRKSTGSGIVHCKQTTVCVD